VGNLGHDVSDEPVRNILQRNGLPPAPERKKGTTWAEFIASHREVLAAADFFTTEVWTLKGLVTYYVLFFIDLASRKVHVAGLTPHSPPGVDEADRPQRHHGRLGLSIRRSLSHP
jgi:hypothetical protein